MKKLILLLLPFTFLFAGEDSSGTAAPTCPVLKEKSKDNGFVYLVTSTAYNRQIKSLLPYYAGIGYRLKMDKNAIDLNISAPWRIIRYHGYNIVTSDFSYVRYLKNNYYWGAGITQEFGHQLGLKFYMLSPLIAFGKEFKTSNNTKMFVQSKINFLTYFPKVELRNYGQRIKLDKKACLKSAFFNVSAGIGF